MNPRRPSYRILKELYDRVGVKSIAYQLRVSESLAYKWIEQPENSEELFGSHTGRMNPLDRTQDLLRIACTEGETDLAIEIINWLARECGGIFLADQTVSDLEKIVQAAKEQTKEKRRA